MRAWIGPLALLALAPALATLADRWTRPTPGATRLSVNELMGKQLEGSFAEVDGKHRFQFPLDHGPHPEFRNEWWYFTGNLKSPQGPLGYELTLFRQALTSPLEKLTRQSAWASRQAFLGHFALSELQDKKFYHFERLSREGLELAGARNLPGGRSEVWLEDWRIKGQGNRFHLQASQDEAQLDLHLNSLKPPVLQGQQGRSQKAERPEQASYYYSLTRLQTRGQVKLGATRREVEGLSWMDREWSTQPLDESLSGWDWLSLQLDQGEEIMVYRLRDREGRATPWSAASWVDARGKKSWFAGDQFQMQPTAFWRSPRDGTEYPSAWVLSLPSRQCQLKVASRLDDQELVGEVARYWEGAVSVEGQINSQSVTGLGYMELVGYQDSGASQP